jgi:hypothetical protein
MSYRTESLVLPIQALSKGFDSYHGPLELPEGSFPDGENLDLRSTNPHTIDGITALNAFAPPDGGIIIWADSYNISAHAGQNPSQPGQIVPAQNVIVLATSAGTIYTFDPVTAVYTQLRTGLNGAPRYWSNARFRDIMLMTNGIDPELQYDGVACYPLGSEPVARFEAADTWATGTGTGVVTTETGIVREGLAAKRFTIAGAQTTDMAWIPPAAEDLMSGLGGAPDFVDADVLRMQVYVSDATAMNTSQVVRSVTGPIIEHAALYTDAAHFEYAQRITVGGTPLTVSNVLLTMMRVGLPTVNFKLEIRTESGGLPTATVVPNGTSGLKPPDAFPTADGIVAFGFSVSPVLSASTNYWIVVKSDGVAVIDPANYLQIGMVTLSGSETLAGNSQGAPNTWVVGANLSTNETAWYQIFGISGALTLRLFSSIAGAPTAQYFTAVSTGGFVNGWNTLTFPRGSFTQVANPAWSTINVIQVVVVTTGSVFLIFDDLVLAYNNSPAPAQIVAVYNGSALLGDQPGDRVKVQFSEVGQINYFLPQNFFRATGGTQSLEDPDRVSALKIYAGIVIVGKPNSIFSLTGAPGQFTLSPFSTEIGIDSHRGVLESPRGVFFPHANSILALRLTSKDILSQNIVGTLGNLDATQADQITGIRDDQTHTLRWSFRQSGKTTNDLQIWYDYYANCWLPPVTAYVARSFFPLIQGTHRRICVIGYDFTIRVCDTLDNQGNASILGLSPMSSRLRLPYRMRPPQKPNDPPLSTHWVGFTGYLRGSAGGTSVDVWFRAADHPFFLDTKAFTKAGTLKTNPTSDVETFVDFGRGVVARYVQVELRSAAGQFELLTPAGVHYLPTERPGL